MGISKVIGPAYFETENVYAQKMKIHTRKIFGPRSSDIGLYKLYLINFSTQAVWRKQGSK